MSNAKRSEVISRIRALRARAANAASSEAEVEAAMRIAAKIIQEHEISEEELVDRGSAGIERGVHNQGRARLHPALVFCSYQIGAFTECRALSRGGENIWIGQPEDVVFAIYLCELIQCASERAWTEIRVGRFNRNIREDFLRGYGDRIRSRLKSLTDERDKARASRETGTSLVVLKAALINEFISETIGEVKDRHNTRFRRALNHGAIRAGSAAADALRLARPIEQDDGADLAQIEAEK